MKNEPVVLYDSQEAASIKTVTGWGFRDGRFFGDNEDVARFSGSTHRKCKNNPDHPIYRVNSYCEVCWKERRNEKFAAMEHAEWDEVTPIVIFDSDTYFFDIDDLRDYCEEHGVTPSQLQLVLCKPNYPSEIDGEDHFCDDLPPDGELPDELKQAFEALNAVIRKSAPLSWSQGDTAVTISTKVGSNA